MRIAYLWTIALFLASGPATALADDLDEVLDDLERFQSQVRAEAQLEGDGFGSERSVARLVSTSSPKNLQQRLNAGEKKPTAAGTKKEIADNSYVTTTR